jgi:hypothetical protein
MQSNLKMSWSRDNMINSENELNKKWIHISWPELPRTLVSYWHHYHTAVFSSPSCSITSQISVHNPSTVSSALSERQNVLMLCQNCLMFMTWKPPEYMAYRTESCRTELFEIHKSRTVPERPGIELRTFSLCVLSHWKKKCWEDVYHWRWIAPPHPLHRKDYFYPSFYISPVTHAYVRKRVSSMYQDLMARWLVFTPRRSVC